MSSLTGAAGAPRRVMLHNIEFFGCREGWRRSIKLSSLALRRRHSFEPVSSIITAILDEEIFYT